MKIFQRFKKNNVEKDIMKITKGFLKISKKYRVEMSIDSFYDNSEWIDLEIIFFDKNYFHRFRVDLLKKDNRQYKFQVMFILDFLNQLNQGQKNISYIENAENLYNQID